MEAAEMCCIVVCVYHICTRRQALPSFMLNSNAKSQRLERPILRQGRNASCGTASPNRQTDAPDGANGRKLRPPGGRPQNRIPLQHSPKNQETGDETRRCRNLDVDGWRGEQYASHDRHPMSQGVIMTKK